MSISEKELRKWIREERKRCSKYIKELMRNIKREIKKDYLYGAQLDAFWIILELERLWYLRKIEDTLLEEE